MENINIQPGQLSKGGLSLYEQVLSKNFEIIENFLKRFHAIFTKQQQFEQTLLNFKQKIQNVEENLQKLRDQTHDSNLVMERNITICKNLIKQKNIRQIQQRQTLQCSSSNILKQQDIKDYIQKEFKNKVNQLSQKLQNIIQCKQKSCVEYDNKFKQMQQTLRDYFSVIDGSLNNDRKDKVYKQELLNLKHLLQLKCQQNIKENIKLNINQIQQKIFRIIQKNQQKIKVQIKQQQDSFKKNFNQKTKLDKEKLLQNIQEVKKSLKIVVEQAAQVFANKKETKRALMLIEKKILRLQLENKIGEPIQQNNNIAGKITKCLSCSHQVGEDLKPKNSLMRPKISNLFNRIQKIEIMADYGKKKLNLF